MQEEKTAEFKLDLSDESVKRNTMKIVWMFQGVTLVDINEKGILKVKGYFDKYVMGEILQQEIDNSVDIIHKSEQNRISGFDTVYNYFHTPKTQEIVVFEFRVLNELIIPAAMEIIWEFSGVTSVEVEKDFYLRVKGGEIKKFYMVTKLKEVDKHVKIIWDGQDLEEAEPPKKQPDVGSSKLQTEPGIKTKNMYGYGYGVPAPQHEPFKRKQGINQAKQPLIYDAAARVHAPAGGPFVFNQHQWIKEANQLPIHDKQNANKPFLQPQKEGVYVAHNHGKKKQEGVFAKMFGLNKEQPQVKKEEGFKRDIQNAQHFDPQIKKGPDGKYHIYNPYDGGLQEIETSLARTLGSKGSTSSFKKTEFGSSGTRSHSSFSRSSSATNLSQSILQSSNTAYSSHSTLPSSSWNPSHSRSRSSENLSQSLSSTATYSSQPTISSNRVNPYQSLKSNGASGFTRGKSSQN
ncbi:PREDICTED: uncharacterized protein LOC104727836 [Camelina sativa]|uniref:Uncharacterized protein LOC104727836 n=1 Tax=Camelina sativa TaxID=90675 RepID=A0ABM0URW1_CAMSA|nr:PREDICTED: uncharacterized protein LOC104727836 [Camelina sativa]